MANKIQLRRDTAANWTRVNPILDDGEPGLNITTNQIKYGDGSTAWNDLPYASGGGGLTDVDGVVTFPGDLLIGTLWPEDPMPGGDKESVVWAKDDTEYLGLWWGGDQTYPDSGYGPVAGIMIGTGDSSNMTDDFSADPSPEDTAITIAINDSAGDTNTWVFDRDGNLTLPGNHSIGTGEGSLGIVTPDAVAIITDNGDTNQLWLFGTDGILTFPDSGLTIGTVAGEVQIGTISTNINILRSGVDGVEIFENEVGFYAGNTKRAQVVPTGLEIISGNLTFPDSTTQSTAFDITKFGEGFSLNGANKIVTNKLYSTNASSPTQHYRLELDTNGVVVLPDQSIINGSTIRGVYGTGEANYTGITIGPDAAHREESWVWVDHTGVSIATEYSTDAYTWKFDNNGSLTLPGGSAIGYTPSVSTNITVNAKTWAFGVDGNLTLPTGGEIHSAAGTGSVAIEANDGNNTRTWTFGTDGSLTVPDTTTQSTAYKRTTGSWTVATGSGTYSFTVPLNGTYAMWVRGKCDNGIITWNATATVTNNNVPVLGQQFAWNYNGGGTPIEITAMPTQFVGTANTVISSNPSVSTPTNTFTFTINNTSGSSQTVYWGYVTQ